MHMILCSGSADKILRIRVDERDVYLSPITAHDDTENEIQIDKADIFGGENSEGGVEGTVYFEQGFQNQTANEFVEDIIGTDIPAYRGETGVVLADMYIGTDPYLKPWDFRIQRIFKSFNGLEQWYIEKAAIPSTDEETILVNPYSTLT